ncbi:MAG: phosphoribosylamine--glycine ligase [Pseudomonadota bacterium]
MHILILGGGGREHALAWAIKQNPKCDRITVAPGNAGIAEIATCAALDILDGHAVAVFAKEHDIDFVVIGPEAPLAAGVADALREAGILCFGPSAAAAQLEASKAFTKEVCDACGAPTARYARFAEADAARAYVAAEGAPIVVKADGLAAGKGVIVAETEEQAMAAIDAMLGAGSAGTEVVIEEFMTGEEASLFVLCDGKTATPIGTAQDHKRLLNGDLGPNTGGMGAYSPAPILTDTLITHTMDEIVKPTLAEMNRRGTPFTGILYAGLMIADGRARLVEYNVRFGDPECQVIAMRLGGQVLDLFLACAETQLSEITPAWADDHALTVVLASAGYPGSYTKGTTIRGLETVSATTKEIVFHAGTALQEGRLVAVGGRVLNATARADNLQAARDAAYALVDRIEWPEGTYRTDIGWRALRAKSV